MVDKKMVVVGGSAGGGKSLQFLALLIDRVRSYDGTSWKNLGIVEHLGDEISKLSRGSIGVRIWKGFGGTIHCVVVFRNSQIKELFE